MRPERLCPAWRTALTIMVASMAIGGCALAPPPSPVPAVFVGPPSPAPSPAVQPPPASTPVPPLPSQSPAAPVHPLEQALAHADRARSLSPAELAQEIARVGDGGDTGLGIMQASVLLAQARGPANTARSQMLLQRLLGRSDAQSRTLHPLARLLAAHLSESRRADEHNERQAQLLRETQRRAEQLSERLEAVRAIERSLPSRPGAGASAPARP